MTATSTLERTEVEVKIVDCDVHLVPRSKDELLDRIPAVLRDRLGSRRANNSSGKEGTRPTARRAGWTRSRPAGRRAPTRTWCSPSCSTRPASTSPC